MGAYNGTNGINATLGSGVHPSAYGGAVAFDAAGRSLVGNGGTVATDANAIGTRTTMYLGRGTSVGAGAPYGDGFYDLVGFSPERLTNAQLQSLAVAA